jgi:hypothetical protein
MKGGIELSGNWSDKTIDEAVTFFLENSMFRIFTTSSISCITLIAKLNSGIQTPFISIDSLNFAKDVTSLLLKIMPSTQTILTPGAASDKASIYGRIDTYHGVEINSYETINRETQTQKDIFRKSILNPTSILDGLCPALVHVINPLPDKNSWKKKYLDNKKLIIRPGKNLMNEIILINQIFNAENMINNRPVNISIILMEFMEGYKVLNDLQAHPNYNQFQQFALYETHQLHLLGYRHRDLHTGNIMVHPDIPYYTTTAEPKHLGMIKIIDFGRTLPLLPEEKVMIQAPAYDFSILAKEKIFKSVFGQNAVLNPAMRDLFNQLYVRFYYERKDFIEKIVQKRLKPFYDFKAIPEQQRTPDKLLRALFPASLYGGLLQTSRKTNYLNNTKDSSQYIMMKGTSETGTSGTGTSGTGTSETDTSETGTSETVSSDYTTNKLYTMLDFDPTYDWDKGRPIVGDTLSEKEQKMTIEDFKNIFSGIFIQNDNEKTMNISQYLKDNLVTTNSMGGKKYKLKKSKSSKNKKAKSKKNKTHKKKYNRKSTRAHTRKTKRIGTKKNRH